MASIVIKDNRDNKEYVLEYNRHALIVMEEQGFNANEFNEKPLKCITLLIRGAFIKNHKDLSEKEIDDLIGSIGDTNKLIEELVKMYSNAINSVLSNNTNSSKNITWGKR